MKRSYGYAWEKLYLAVMALAIGPGDVRSRLLQAYYVFHTLDSKHFPPELKKDWQWVMAQITKYGPVFRANGEVWKGSVENTMSKIRNSTGTKIAEKILDMFWELEKIEGPT